MPETSRGQIASGQITKFNRNTQHGTVKIGRQKLRFSADDYKGKFPPPLHSPVEVEIRSGQVVQIRG